MISGVKLRVKPWQAAVLGYGLVVLVYGIGFGIAFL